MTDTTPVAFLPCCGGLVKLTRTKPNTYHGVETHNPHCQEAAC